MIDLHADDAAALDAALARIAPPVSRVGSAVLRRIAGIDTGLVARFGPEHAQLMPHAGPAVVRGVLKRLAAAGRAPEIGTCARGRHPEAADLVEACLLDVLAQAPSGLTIDTLAAQPAAWRDDAPAASAAESGVLARLLAPPVVAAGGPANVGKSTLLNALARRRVALVDPRPGTTRDHVGATLELAGLAVRWIDTPGLRTGAEASERRAIAASAAVVAAADLVVLCGDAASGVLPEAAGGRPALRCATRADLGPLPGADVETSAALGDGLGDLAAAIREWLVPEAVRTRHVRWRFHPDLPPP